MVVRMRSTKSHTGNRRAHHALRALKLSVCSNCKAPMIPHRVCRNCGFYRGKKVLDLVRKTERKQKKEKEKKART
ncbi:MAG: 50S ribosomal protein L32 [Patescibacteria group bacterium]